MVDWTKLPDLGTVALLATAFATVARRSQTPVSSLWLTGWVLIAIHFAALIFATLPGLPGTFAVFVALVSLAWAGLLFMWAAVPYRKESSSIRMMILVLCTNLLYISATVFGPGPEWLLPLSAVLLGAGPLAVAISTARSFMHPLRYVVVVMYVALSILLLGTQNNPNPDFGLDAVFSTIYFGCALHFFFVFRRLGTAVIVTTAGFLAWASVFVVAPSIHTYLPSIQFESEVWNLPKYIVAVGMILIVLQQQIEHNKHLALHDELTGLPNRRLFQDRLASALERARRSGTRTGLLLVDLDRFKQVNDSVGHHGGDEVLKHVAQVLQGRIRRSDTVARTGGDEFSIILEEPVTRDDAERVSRSLIELLHQSLAFEGHTIRIGASIGLAIYPEDAPNSETLRVAADLRMYAYKNKTRGTVEIRNSEEQPSSRSTDTIIESRNTA
jgi:diguanylate cyclase (GGDEF)-like protein